MTATIHYLSSRAEHKPEHYRFQREQSNTQRMAEWEDRIRPVEPLWKAWANGIAAVFVAFVILKLMGLV